MIRKRRYSSWYDARANATPPIQTSARPRVQELRRFRAWLSRDGMLPHMHQIYAPNVARECNPTLYGGKVVDDADTPKGRMAAHAHRSIRARNNVHATKLTRKVKGVIGANQGGKESEAEEKKHKGDAYTDAPQLWDGADDLPELTTTEQALVDKVYTNPMDAGEEHVVREHVVARLFARVAALEDGTVYMGNATEGERLQVLIDREERKALDAEKGAELNRKIFTLAMRLHAREPFTDAVACDGSKKEQVVQPWNTTSKMGPTAYGQYGGPKPKHITAWAARFQREIPTYTEMAEAVQEGAWGHRISDEADTMQAELAAIFTYLQSVVLNPDANDRRVLVLSDCYNALRAIEETWRGKGKPYRERSGGAVIEAINNIRQQLGSVVFIYVPSHAGVVPNAYADGIAKAYLDRLYKLNMHRIIARLVTSRSVIYVKQEAQETHLNDGPTYKHTRKGTMEWVRTRSKSMYREPIWNQKVLSVIGRGPKPPTDEEEGAHHITPDEAKEYAIHATQRMRITCGYRTNKIAGGPQGEEHVLRAARVKGSAAEMIIQGGCRGCIAKKVWPGERESTAHMHECPGREARELARWRTDVYKKLTYLATYLKAVGQDGRTAYAQIQQAATAIRDRNLIGESYEAVRHTAGGAIPTWDDNVERNDRKHNEQVIHMLVDIQKLFIERVRQWTTFMAPTGWRRQSRWQGKAWIRLVFHMFKENAKGGCRRDVEHVEMPQDATTHGPIHAWTIQSYTVVQRMLHSVKCIEQYIKWIAKPQMIVEQAAAEARNRIKLAKWSICAYLVRVYKQCKQEQVLLDRADARRGLICAHTRNVGRLTPKNGVTYSDTRRYKPRIPDTEYYRLHRWPRRDKCGPTLAATLYYVWGIT